MPNRIPTPDQKVRVFISSCLGELAPERSSVKRTIDKIPGLAPVGFDDGATTYPPRDVYTSWLEQSPIYVGVFWQSYGQVIPELGISGIEEEFNIACRMHKKRLVYFKEPAPSRDARIVELRKRIEADRQVSYKSFGSERELARLLRDDLGRVLVEPFLVEPGLAKPSVVDNFLTQVLLRMAEHGCLERPDSLRRIEALVQSNRWVLLVGDPGIGKTYLLAQVGRKMGALYVSLRNRSPLQVYSYLSGRLRLAAGLQPESYANSDNALLGFEGALQNTAKTIVFDDVDQNPAVVQGLLGLEPYGNRFVFGARSTTDLAARELVVADAPPFTEQEIDDYLKLEQIEVSPGQRIELARTSRGNPLYLNYFARRSLDPLPDGLMAYQSELLRGLSTTERELAGLVAVSLFRPSLHEITLAYNKHAALSRSEVEVAGALASMSGLLTVSDGRYALFHPYFRESVIADYHTSGLDIACHRSMGEVSYDEGRMLEAAYHLTKCGDERTDEYLLPAADSAIAWGLWDIAGSLLARLISVSETKAEPRMEGIARYRLAFILRDQARFEQAEAEIKGAIRAFKASGSTAWERAARMEEALDKSLRDRGHEAIQTLKDLLGQLGDEDRLWRATVQVNLAYVCQEMGRFREGADAAKAAFDLFLKEGDSEGVLTSLTNLTACLGQLDLHVLAEPYARRIVKLGVALQRPRIKAAGLNQLASSLRAKGDPRRAIDCLREAISICQQLDMQRTELTNILNLGNAYKDLQDWEHAEDCYQEGLTRAKVAGFGPVVGHALLLFAMLRQAQSRYEEALSFAKEAGDANQKIGQQLRVAQAHAAAARALSSLGKHAEAAQEFEEAAAGVGQVGDLQESTSHHVSASKEWAQAGNTQRCVVSVDAALSGHLGRDDITSAADALSGLTDNFSLDGLHERFDKLFGQYLADPSRANLAGTMHSYSTYCKRSRNGKPGTQFFSTLSLLAKHAAVHPNVLSALVIGIEQADERLLSSRQLDTLASSLVDSLDGFSYRVLPDLSSVCTTIWPQDPPVVIQVISLSKELVLRRLALATTLAMLAGEKQVLLDVSAAGQLRGSTSAFFFALLDDFEKNVMKLPEGSVTDEMPAIMMESNVPFAEPQPAMPIIIHDSYPSIADWSVHPQNKALVWLLMNVYAQTVEQLTHMKLRDDAPTARRARQFCEVLFGYRNSTDTNEELLIPRYRVADIDAVLKSLKSNG